jgi:hypothetical protein
MMQPSGRPPGLRSTGFFKTSKHLRTHGQTA